MPQPRAVFVTGGAGFVGSHVIDALLAGGSRVRAIVRASSSQAFLDSGRIELHVADIADDSPPAFDTLVAAMRGSDVVLHVAGVVVARSAADYERVNVAGAERVARAAAAARVPRLLLVSSQAAAGPSPSAGARSEDEPEQPATTYGRSKLAGERVTMQVSAQTGIEVVIVRPPAVYGPRDRAFLQMFRMINAGVLALHPGAERQEVSVIHARDLARGILLAAERAHAGRTYFLTDGARHTAAGLGDAIASALGKRPLRVRVPAWGAWLAASTSEGIAALTGRPAFLTRERLRQWTAPYWTISDARARREIGYQSDVELRDGMAEAAAWYRSAGWL